MKACGQWKSQTASYTAQDITWNNAVIKTWTACNNTRKWEKHVAEHEPHATQNTTQLMWTEKRTWVNSRPHPHTTRQNMEHECPNPDTEPKLSLNKTWVPGSERHAPTWNKAHRWEYTRSRMLTRKQRNDGSVRDLKTEVTEPWQ